MVYGKMKLLRVLIVFSLALIFILGLFFNKNEVQYSLVKAILPSSVSETSNIIPLSDRTSKIIHIIFESEDEERIEEVKDAFLSEIPSDDFEIINLNPEKLFDYYERAPSNFLSTRTRELLKNKNYEIIYREGLERLYNPIGIQLAGADKDPYSLLSDFVLSGYLGRNTFLDGKNYSVSDLKLKQNTSSVKELITLKHKYSDKGINIYMAGTPVHTYLTSRNANFTINLICAFLTLLIIGLTWVYYKNLKVLPFIALSIIFGFLGGLFVAKATFLNFHIITVLFGVTLIGIGVDYSIHYLFLARHDKSFYKNLTLSMLSTALAFSLLFFLKIEVMSQIALFTILGLFFVFLFILLIYPIIDFPKPQKSINIDLSKKIKISVWVISFVVIAFGLFHLHFNDNLSALYTPTKELKEGEALYIKLTNPKELKTHFLTVRGRNLEETAVQEEKITDILEKEGVDYLCVSRFLPSKERQRENFELVKSLYDNNLNNFKEILTPQQIQALKNSKFKYEKFDSENAPYLNNFVLSPELSLIMYFSPEKISFSPEITEEIDIQADVSEYLKNYRIKLMKLLPFVYFLIFILFFAFYGRKKSAKMFAPILLSSLFTVSFLSLFSKLNLFHLIALLLVLGFTVDYSLFSSEKNESTKNAIFFAGLTTCISFLLLSFSGFTLLGSIALTLFAGILSSYIFIKVFE